MPLRIQTVLMDAWALFRRDRDWLLRLAGPFLFLPPFALALLVPSWPPAPAGEELGREERMLAWAELVAGWAAENGGWYLIGFAVTAFGSAALFAAYLDRGSADVQGALHRAGVLLPRYLLAMVLVGIPVLAGLFLWVLPGLYMMGRTMLTGPALLAERPVGAATAMARSFSLTSGAGLPLMALAAMTLFGGFVLAQPFAAVEVAAGGSVPAQVFAALGFATVSALTNIAQALIAVSAYRRLLAR